MLYIAVNNEHHMLHFYHQDVNNDLQARKVDTVIKILANSSVR